MASACEAHHAAGDVDLSRFFLLLLLVLAVLYAAGLNAHWRYHRDSVLHIGLARSLAEEGTYRFNHASHVFVLPGFPAMLSLIYLSIGENFLAMNLLVSLFGIGSVILAYFLMRELSLSPRQVVACVLLFGLSRSLYHYSAYVTTDVPFTFLTLAGLYCGARMLRAGGRAGWLWCIAAGGAACAASLVRPLGPAVLMGLLAGLWLKRDGTERWRTLLGKTVVLLAPFIVVLGAWVCRCVLVRDAEGWDYLTIFLRGRSPTERLAWALKVLPDYPSALADVILGKHLGRAAGIPLLVPILVGLGCSVRRGDVVALVYALVYLLALLLVGPNRRYLLPLLPLLAYWLVLGVGAIANWLVRRRTPVSARRLLQVAYVLLGLIVAANIGRTGKIIYEARSPDYYRVANEGRLVDYFRLADWLKEHARPDEVVLARESWFLHYFSRLKTHGLKLVGKWTDTDRLARHLSEKQVDYVVCDPRTRERALPGGDMLRAYPGAFEEEVAIGELKLFRVRVEKLDEGARAQ